MSALVAAAVNITIGQTAIVIFSAINYRYLDKAFVSCKEVAAIRHLCSCGCKSRICAFFSCRSWSGIGVVCLVFG